MAWSGIEAATSRSRVRRANHSATLPLWQCNRKFVAPRIILSHVIAIKKKIKQDDSEATSSVSVQQFLKEPQSIRGFYSGEKKIV